MHLSVTYILIGINILVFAAETMAGGTENRETALKFGAMYAPYIKKGQWYRMFTSMFLHDICRPGAVSIRPRRL